MKKFQQAIIHIGLHKTGTTFIQRSLFTERQWLAEHADLYYPVFDENQSLLLATLFNQRNVPNVNHLQMDLTSRELVEEQRKLWLQDLEKELQETSCSRLLFSGEDTSLWNIAEVEAFRDWLEPFVERVTILVFFRDPFSWATSYIQQILKIGAKLKEFYQAPYSLEEEVQRVKPWIAAYGKDAITALDFGTACRHPQGLLGAFLEVAKLPKSFIEVAPTNDRANTSLYKGATFLLNALNEVHPLVVNGKITPLRINEPIYQLHNLHGPKFQLPPEILKVIGEKSQEAAQWLQETFGIHYSLDIPETTEDSAWFDDESAAHLILCFLKHPETLAQLDAANHQLKKEQQARIKAEKKLQQVNKKLKQIEKRSKSFKKQVETWNHRSWWTRAFHRLRLK